MLENGLTSYDQAQVPVMDVRVLDQFLAEDSTVCSHLRHLEQIMDVVPQHMFILEADGALSFVNRAAREYLGAIEDVSLNDRLTAISHPEDLDSLFRTYRDAFAHGVPVETEARVSVNFTISTF